MEGIVLIGEAGIHHYLIKTVGAPEEVQRVTTLDGRKPVIPEIEEKPENPRSNNAVTRVYMYDPGVFDMIRRTKPSAHGELETNSADSEHRKQNNLTYGIVGAERMDTSAVELYQHANALLFSIDNTIQPGEYHADTL